jgi:hypothetical protein
MAAHTATVYHSTALWFSFLKRNCVASLESVLIRHSWLSGLWNRSAPPTRSEESAKISSKSSLFFFFLAGFLFGLGRIKKDLFWSPPLAYFATACGSRLFGSFPSRVGQQPDYAQNVRLREVNKLGKRAEGVGGAGRCTSPTPPLLLGECICAGFLLTADHAMAREKNCQ